VKSQFQAFGYHLIQTVFESVKQFKSRVHCFSMQVLMNKCFLLNPEKILAQIRLVFFQKNVKKHT